MHRNLLWIDSRAALLAGALTLLLSGWLAPRYGLPAPLLLATAVANLAYGCYSGWLLVQPRPRPVVLIHTLVVANALWALVCLLIAAWHFAAATWLGLSHLLLEAVFVGGLAVQEWRQRLHLQTAT